MATAPNPADKSKPPGNPGSGPSGGHGIPDGEVITPDTPADSGARAIIQQALAAYGLEGLAGWAWTLHKEGQDINMILAQLPKQPEFIARYPAYEFLAQQGRAISVQQYRAYEDQVIADLRRYGVPQGMYDTPAAIGNLLKADVSAVEVGERLQLAARAAYSAPIEVREALRDRYGVQDGDMVGFYLDPEKALPLLDARYKAAEVAGAAALSNINVATEMAERLANQGVAYGTAVQGFANVRGMSDLKVLEQGTGNVTEEELIGAQFGEGDAAARVDRVRGARAARYQAAEGGAASSQTGVSGLRSAQR